MTIRGGYSRRDGPVDLFMIGVRHFLKSSAITVAITVTIRQWFQGLSSSDHKCQSTGCVANVLLSSLEFLLPQHSLARWRPNTIVWFPNFVIDLTELRVAPTLHRKICSFTFPRENWSAWIRRITFLKEIFYLLLKINRESFSINRQTKLSR